MQTHIDKFGRMVIPKAMREKFRLEPGTALEIEEQERGFGVRAVSSEPAVVFKNGLLMSTARPPADIDDAIARSREERMRSLLGGREE